MDPKIISRAETWLNAPFDQATQREVRDLLEKNPEKLTDAFFKDLSFGTGGMRGLMGSGTNRMNIYTIRAATLGLANYLNSQSRKNPAVFIGYDVRHYSKEFAQEAACVLAANQIRVFITEEICPTPLVSFGCRHYGCSAAIMITASHNPPAYNGYKVYWSDGGQVVSPHDEGIIAEVRKIPLNSKIALSSLKSPLITFVDKQIDEAYLANLKKWQLIKPTPVKILYSPLHGTGIRIIPDALKSWGYSDVTLISEQKNPDPNFTNAPSPNPEEKSALAIGSKQLLESRGDIFIATDPDADRIGLVIRDKEIAIPLTGNQTACLILYHICTQLRARGEIPLNAAFVKTIVTTELFAKISKDFGGACIDVLTGFKYIAEQITLWEQSFDAYQFLFGAEESYGCLYGTMSRDKDSISAACILAEIAALAKKQNINLIDRLYQIYQKYGIHRESLTNLNYPDSQIGMLQMQALMDRLRKQPPAKINGIEVLSIEDYLLGVAKNLKTKHKTPLYLPKSDVLRFWLSDGSKLIIRPSGTEPKVKLYTEVVQETIKHLPTDIALCDERLKALAEAFKSETSI
jgi:phosphoglucomutase/phosphomannomutase